MSPAIGVLELLLLFLLFLAIPGTIMGWLAAGQIRRSDGMLYGMRLAAFAGLFWPVVFIALFPIILGLILIRAGSFSPSVDQDTSLLFVVPVLITGAILGVKLSLALTQRVTKGEPLIAGFFKRLTRLTKGSLLTIWVVVGVIFAIQFPRQTDPTITSESNNSMFSAQGSTMRSTRIFKNDQFSYRFEVQGLGGSYDEKWIVPVPMDKFAKDFESVSPEDYSFHQEGSIVWGTQMLNGQFAGTSHVIFKVGDVEVFRVDLPNPDRS